MLSGREKDNCFRVAGSGDERRSPRLSRKHWPTESIGPRVSRTIWTQICVWLAAAYFAFLHNAAAYTAPHSVTDGIRVCELAIEHNTVTSYVKLRPLC